MPSDSILHYRPERHINRFETPVPLQILARSVTERFGKRNPILFVDGCQAVAVVFQLARSVTKDAGADQNPIDK